MRKIQDLIMPLLSSDANSELFPVKKTWPCFKGLAGTYTLTTALPKS